MRLFILLFFVSCSSLPDSVRVHVSTFERLCGKKVNIPIYFRDLPLEKDGQILGVCYGFKQSVMFRSIVLDRNYYDSANYWERESLILHELGHCVLDRPHQVAYDDDYQPLTIMHPYSFRSYFNRRRDLLLELCN